MHGFPDIGEGWALFLILVIFGVPLLIFCVIGALFTDAAKSKRSQSQSRSRNQSSRQARKKSTEVVERKRELPPEDTLGESKQSQDGQVGVSTSGGQAYKKSTEAPVTGPSDEGTPGCLVGMIGGVCGAIPGCLYSQATSPGSPLGPMMIGGLVGAVLFSVFLNRKGLSLGLGDLVVKRNGCFVGTIGGLGGAMLGALCSDEEVFLHLRVAIGAIVGSILFYILLGILGKPKRPK